MRYAIVRDGVVENVVVAEPGWNPSWEDVEAIALSDEDHVAPGWRLEGGQFVAVEAEPAREPIKTTMTKYQFRRRFTLDELVRFDNPELFVELTPHQRAMVNTLMRSFEAATEIDLNDAQLRLGLQLMVDWGLLTPERRDEILNPAWSPALERQV